MCKTFVLVFGGNGMLGRYVTQYLKKINTYKVFSLDRSNFDVMKDSYSKLMNIILKHLGTWCVVCNIYYICFKTMIALQRYKG